MVWEAYGTSVENMTEAIDLAEYKTAHGAAKATGRKIEEIADDLGQDPDLEVTVEKREGRFGERWVVSWPGGPFDWATVLCGGESLFAGEHPSVRGGENSPQVENLMGHGQDWNVECENRTTLAFYP